MKKKKAKAKRVNISIDHRLEVLAHLIMDKRIIKDFSGFIETLIREEAERRGVNLPHAEESPDRKAAAVVRRHAEKRKPTTAKDSPTPQTVEPSATTPPAKDPPQSPATLHRPK